MTFGRVIGRVWSTVKNPQMDGIRMVLVQPLTPELQPTGRRIVCTDSAGAGTGVAKAVTIASSSSDCLTGLVSAAANDGPARCRTSPAEVSRMIRGEASCLSLAISAASMKPSTSGINASVSTRRYGARRRSAAGMRPSM